MSRILFSVYCLFLFAGWQGVSSADDNAGERKRKFQANPKQPTALQQATKELKRLKRQLQQATKELKRLKRQLNYINTEVKGVVRYELFSAGFGEWRGSYWTITTKSFKWQLDFGLLQNKQVLKIAKENVGKAVVVTGIVTTRPGTFYSGPTGFGQTTILVVNAIKAAKK